MVLQVRGVSDACFFSWSEAAKGEDRWETVISCCNLGSPYLCSSYEMCADVHPAGPAAVLCSSAMATARDSGDEISLNKVHRAHIPSRGPQPRRKSFSIGVHGPAALPGSTKMPGLRGSETSHSDTACPGQHFRRPGVQGETVLDGVYPGATTGPASLSLDFLSGNLRGVTGLSRRRMVRAWRHGGGAPSCYTSFL